MTKRGAPVRRNRGKDTKKAKKGQAKKAEEIATSSDQAAVQSVEELNLERKALIKALREACDLPSTYAALKLIRESSFLDFLTEEEKELVSDASLAVPYIMSNLAVEHCTRPRSLGGLAYSRAKAENLIRSLFAKMGPACCADDVKEKDIEKACKDISSQDARKIVPKLKQVGTDAKRKVEELREQLLAARPKTTEKGTTKSAVAV